MKLKVGNGVVRTMTKKPTADWEMGAMPSHVKRSEVERLHKESKVREREVELIERRTERQNNNRVEQLDTTASVGPQAPAGPSGETDEGVTAL